MASNRNYRIEITNSNDVRRRLRLLNVSIPLFLGEFLKKVGNRLLTKVKFLTPVDTGNLRRKWSLKSPSYSGDNVEIEILNNTEYAMPVELGHRTRSGGFVPGRFMLKQSMDEIGQTIESDLEQEIQRHSNSVLGG